jgi:KamA family protein
MQTIDNIFYKPRKYNTIELWKDVKEEQWNDVNWQRRNSIRSVAQLKKIIKLNDFQASEIERTLTALKNEGKEALRITPYYASLMQEDPFHPTMLPDEKSEKRLDPIFWQSVPTPANLLFPDTGLEGAMNENSRSYGAVYQRYPNRVALFVAENTSCASYCVHCQRAKSLDCSADVNGTEIDKGLFYIGYNKNINEVLVTGGDALMISRSRLQYVLEELSRIPHLRAIRIATRVPVVMPMGITDDLLELINVSANKYNKGLDARMLRFIENHDEVRLASMAFAGDAKVAIPAMTLVATMNRGPVMIYGGQEVGEPAQGESGFSGDDGRTTIYDYFAMPEHQKWMNNGKFDGGGLSADQTLLRQFYQKILNFSLRYDAIANGEFYDLMWANPYGSLPQRNKIYIWLRHTSKQKLLFVISFDKSHDQQIRIKISDHAFNEMGWWKCCDFEAKELLWNMQKLQFDRKTAIETGLIIDLRPNDALIFEIVPKDCREE